MELPQILQFMGFTPDVDFEVLQRGELLELQWLSQQPQPTQAEIAAAELPAAKASTIAANRAECSRRIFDRYPAGRQLSALAGLYPAENVQAMTDWIALNIAAENTAADAIEAATTVQAVESVAVVWPV